MVLRIVGILLALSFPAAAGVITDVRGALARNDLKTATATLESYRAQHGVDPEYLEALSWMGRGELAAGDFAQAYKFSQDTQKQTVQFLKGAKVDSQPHVAIALGAAFEVQAQSLAKQNQTEKAVLLLRDALKTYGGTSIRARLQKNLNLLTFIGKPAPPLIEREYLGPKPASLADLKGSVVMLFFWAHWCGDCKAEAPIIASLQSEFAKQGLVVVAPTQRYGYAGAQDNISPEQETQYIESVRQRYYAQLSNDAVPVSKENFDLYGASTTPTIVLIARSGKISLYHPGAMPYGELRPEIEKLISAK
ncbi:MAG TPA: TlpA disulfide reductase family protein [Candidatus Angelobacter sp.]|nr:TlpA disulfide reductase family protein [Candidatus Angelobacter sp.]